MLICNKIAMIILNKFVNIFFRHIIMVFGLYLEKLKVRSSKI